MIQISNAIIPPELLRHFQLIEFEFTPEQRDKILHQLKLSAENPGANEFIKQSQRAIGIYQIRKLNAQVRATPKKTLTRLQVLRRQIIQTLKALTNLDAEVESRLRLAYKDPTKEEGVMITPEPFIKLDELTERLMQLKNILDDQISRAQTHIQRGRAIDVARRHAINQIVESYGLSFGHFPPSTQDSTFERALAVILKVGGVVLKDLHKPIQTAIKKAKGQKFTSA